MIWLIILVFIIDVISKILISKYLTVYESYKIINNFFYITYVKNTGVAFSFFNDSWVFILIISILIIGGIIVYLYYNRPKNMIEKIAYSLILGGAFGNFCNRLFFGYVVDFIDVRIFGYDYPIFNLADIFIVSGVIMLIILTWRGNDDRVRGTRR